MAVNAISHNFFGRLGALRERSDTLPGDQAQDGAADGAEKERDGGRSVTVANHERPSASIAR